MENFTGKVESIFVKEVINRSSKGDTLSGDDINQLIADSCKQVIDEQLEAVKEKSRLAVNYIISKYIDKK